MKYSKFPNWCVRNLEVKRNELGQKYIPVGVSVAPFKDQFKTITAVVYGNNVEHDIQDNAKLVAAAPEMLEALLAWKEATPAQRANSKTLEKQIEMAISAAIGL